MSIRQQCWGFEALLKWQEENRIEDMGGKMEALRRPEVVAPLRMGERLRELVEGSGESRV